MAQPEHHANGGNPRVAPIIPDSHFQSSRTNPAVGYCDRIEAVSPVGMEAFINLIYRTGARVRAFEAKYPDDTVLVSAGCKALRTDVPIPLERSSRWVFSRRAVVIVSDRRVVCGGWEFDLSDIQQARASVFKGLLSSGQVLIIHAGSWHYQIGTNTGEDWLDKLPFEVSRSENSLTMSPFSKILRLSLIAAAAYYLAGYVI